MRPNVYAAGLLAVLIGAMACVGSAAAETTTAKKKKAAANPPPPRARITVDRRSFLDAGTEVLPGERKFTDYAFPPGHTPYSALGPLKSFWRQPLLDPWDVPGTNKGW